MSFFLIALIAAVAGQIIGWAWFMPLFGKKWMWVVTDNQSQEMQYPMWVPLLINLIINYIFAFALFFVFGILGVPNLAAACIVGAIVSIVVVIGRSAARPASCRPICGGNAYRPGRSGSAGNVKSSIG
jgi:branched-subunit amino acid ABC-type transport system permease component